MEKTEQKVATVTPDINEETRELTVYTAQDGKLFLDKAEAQYYTERLRDVVEHFTIYTATSGWVVDEEGQGGYSQDNLILVDKRVNDSTNVFTIAHIIQTALGVVPYASDDNGALQQNFNLELEVPRVETLQEVESWKQVHYIAKRFLAKDNERMQAALSPEALTDDTIHSYNTLLVNIVEDEETGDMNLDILEIGDDAYLRNTLRIIAGDKPYVS